MNTNLYLFLLESLLLLSNSFLIESAILTKLHEHNYVKEYKQNESIYIMSCSSAQCQDAISNCVNKFSCLGKYQCHRCVGFYNNCSQTCLDNLLDPNGYVSITEQLYLPCDGSVPLQLNACRFICRSSYYLYSQCVYEGNYPLCKCSRTPFTISSSATTATATTISTTTTKLQTSTTQASQANPLNIVMIDSEPIHDLAVLDNGDLVTSSKNVNFTIWDIQSKAIRRRIVAHNYWISCLIALPNDTFASGGADNYIKIWNANNGTLKRILNGHTNIITALALLNNGDLASSSDDKTIKIWNFETTDIKRTLTGFMYSLTSLAVLNNGYLVSGDGHQMFSDNVGTIKVWDAHNGKLIRNLVQNVDYVECLVVLSNGDLVSSHSEHYIKIWDAFNGVLKRIIDGYSRQLYLTALPNGYLATGNAYGNIDIWDTENNVLRQILSGHIKEISSMSLMKNGKLVSVSLDRTVRIWSSF
jgi:WD40 repeat protein